MSDSLWAHGLYSSWNSLGQNTGVGSLTILQRIFPTQESNQGLLHCRQILYQLSYQGSPVDWLYPPPNSKLSFCCLFCFLKLHYLFTFGCAVSLLLCGAFLYLWRRRAPLKLPCTGFSCCGPQALGHTGCSICGTWALEHRLSSCVTWV